MRIRQTEGDSTPTLLYLLTLAIMLGASYVPQWRLWGFGTSAFLPSAVRIALAAAGLIPIVWLQLRPFSDARADTETSSGYRFTSLVLVVAFGALFTLFPAQTFFLGDGYQNLTSMADGNTIVKLTSLGEGGFRGGLAGLLQVTDTESALMVFRVIAVACGIAFLLLAALTARVLFEANLDRLLFTLGMATGGYALLFFGYVEQYSIFVVAVEAFVLVGVLIGIGRINRWWIVPVFLLTVIAHIFGAMLLPAALYLVLADTRFGQRLRRLRPATLVVMALAALVVVVTTGVIAFRQSALVRWAVIPVVDGLFAYDHYTLPAPAHWLDFINLVFLLLPAALLGALMISLKKGRKAPRDRPGVFLLVALLSAFGGLFWIDPKLGLPRDWDLFSFAGVPLVALFYWLALAKSELSPRLGRTIAVLGIALGCLSLGPRVATMRMPEAGVAQFRSYLALDHDRGLRGYYLLKAYYDIRGDSTAAAQSVADWHQAYPERAVFYRGLALKDAGQWAQALPEFRTAIRLNGTYSDVWSHMGECYMRLRKPDSAEACFRRALRLNPYEAAVWNNLGNVCLRAGRLEEAEHCLTEAHKLLGEEPANLYNLASLYLAMRRMDRYQDYLIRSARFPQAPPGLHKELANLYMTRGNLDSAAVQYRIGLQKGLDTAFVRAVIASHPALARLVPLE